MATFYDDLGKSADDLIAKGFPADGSLKVSSETKTSNGVSLNTNARRFLKAGQEGVELLFEPKFNWAEKNVEVTGKFSTEGAYEAGLSATDLGAKGTKFSVTGIHGKAGCSVKGGIDFKNENVAVKSSVVYPDDPASKPVLVEASAVAAYENVNVGGKVNYTTSFAKSDKETASSFFWNAKVGYIQPLWQLVAYYNNANGSNVVGGSFWQVVSPSVKLGSNFSVDRLSAKAAPTASLAGDYKIAADTSAKAKVTVSPSKDLRLALALQQNWTSSSTVTIGADLNAVQLLGSNSGSAHTFGLEIKLK